MNKTVKQEFDRMVLLTIGPQVVTLKAYCSIHFVKPFVLFGPKTFLGGLREGWWVCGRLNSAFFKIKPSKNSINAMLK